MLDTIIRRVSLSVIKHHQVFSYLNCYVTTKGRLQSETVACTGWSEKLAKNQTKKDFFGLLKLQKIETETVLKVSSKGKDKKAAKGRNGLRKMAPSFIFVT